MRHEVKLVAIERPDGLLVERLLEAGLRILPLHPNQVTATRDRFRVSGGKSDRFDAFVLCELARTDHHRFRVLEPDSDQTKALRALTRAREDLVGTRTALSNQLRAELARFWPGPLGCSRTCTAGSRSRSLSATPAPADTRGLGAARLQGFLARERYTGRQKPAQLLAKLRRAPEARVGELELRTRRQLVLSLVTTIKTINGQIKQLERQIATAMREHPDGAIFLSLFKKPSSVICAAELLAEIGDCRERYPPATRSLPTPARPPSRSSPANAKPPASAGPATGGCARRSSRWRTAPATTTPGPKASTPAPATAGTSTPARSAPSGAPGAGSCGAVGKTGCRTNRRATAPCNSTSPSPSRPYRGPYSTTPPRSACSRAPSPPARTPDSKR
ncbi:MAG TPA: transposase [Solirubrobacteraceae bacterium]|nr:transposase [Solirubrobacteraceae bacterium]